MGKRARANRIPDERKRELLEVFPYCPCGAVTTVFHHLKTGAGVKDHARENLIGVCELCHRRIHGKDVPEWYVKMKGEMR